MTTDLPNYTSEEYCLIPDPGHLDFAIAHKVKPVLTKRLSAIFADQVVLERFVLQTIEGNEDFYGQNPEEVMICLGIGKDIWAQKIDTLKKKYKLLGFRENGWAVHSPREGVPTDAVKIDLIERFDNLRNPCAGMVGKASGFIRRRTVVGVDRR